jgi:hypothetical protein
MDLIETLSVSIECYYAAQLTIILNFVLVKFGSIILTFDKWCSIDIALEIFIFWETVYLNRLYGTQQNDIRHNSIKCDTHHVNTRYC